MNSISDIKSLLDLAGQKMQQEIDRLTEENRQLRMKHYDRWFNKAQAAKYAGVTRPTIYSWIQDPDNPLPVEGGKIRRSVLDTYRRERRTL